MSFQNRARQAISRSAQLLFFWICIGLITTSARAAGVQVVTIPEGPGGPKITAWIWTPCAIPPKTIVIDGPLTITGVENCPVRGERLPLVVISHGLAGAFISHHDTAEGLADAGFVVVALNHSYDSARDMKRSDDLASLIIRPTDIRRVIDFTLGNSPVAASIDARRIGFFGFSRGGFTGLVLAGGDPDYSHPSFPCPEAVQMCKQIKDKDIPAHGSGYEPRIKAFVIADPVDFFPDWESLKNIKAPIQLWASEQGGQGVRPEDAAFLAKNIPSKPEFHPVPNSTHMSFIFPCSQAFAKTVPAFICGDPPGFDRAAFHRSFNRQVLAFFQKELRR
jgi:predicted dienelactone hydrolase